MNAFNNNNSVFLKLGRLLCLLYVSIILLVEFVINFLTIVFGLFYKDDFAENKEFIALIVYKNDGRKVYIPSKFSVLPISVLLWNYFKI